MLKHDSTEVELLSPTYPELFGANLLIEQHQPTNAYSITQINNSQCFNNLTMKPIKNCKLQHTMHGNKMKLEMEEFRDLTDYLPTSVTCKTALNIGDELNTPIFEGKGPFDFTHQYIPHNEQHENLSSTEDPFVYKVKTEQPELNVLNDVIAHSNDIFKNNLRAEERNYLDNNNKSVVTNDSILFSPCNSDNGDNQNNSFKQRTPMMDDLQYLQSVENFKDFLLSQNTWNSSSDSNPTYGESSPKKEHVAYDTPENSNSGSEMEYTYSKLHLNITGKVYDSYNSLSTPDVIKTITDIENDSFNILDIVTDKEIETVSTEDLHLNVPSLPVAMPPAALSSTVPPKVSSIVKSPRKRRSRIDSDEDYIPPGKIGRKSIKMTQKPPSSYDSDSNSSEDDTAMQMVRRGRPPKRNVSVSSDCSRESGATKYRELRDKNNEASRRSRLKRKMKEMNMEKEADELEERNLKLKTQVSELEKSVNNFRSNLFKIMLSK